MLGDNLIITRRLWVINENIEIFSIFTDGMKKFSLKVIEIIILQT